MTKAQAFAQGITLCRWRNMQYRTERGKQRLSAYRNNASHARKARIKCYYDPSSFKDPTATPAKERETKRLQEQIRRLTIELHCREMRKIHSANAAARRLQKQ